VRLKKLIMGARVLLETQGDLEVAIEMVMEMGEDLAKVVEEELVQ